MIHIVTSSGLFIRVKLVRVERSRSLVQLDTCKFSAIKNLVQIVKYLEFLAKVYSTIAGNADTRHSAHVCIARLLFSHVLFLTYRYLSLNNTTPPRLLPGTISAVINILYYIFFSYYVILRHFKFR